MPSWLLIGGMEEMRDEGEKGGYVGMNARVKDSRRGLHRAMRAAPAAIGSSPGYRTIFSSKYRSFVRPRMVRENDS